ESDDRKVGRRCYLLIVFLCDFDKQKVMIEKDFTQVGVLELTSITMSELEKYWLISLVLSSSGIITAVRWK
ncbi:hypothetical protein VIGAN_08099200, partial [Vigna angularis var. angularis]